MQYIQENIIFPATKSDDFRDKAFTENILSQIIKNSAPKSSFICDDNFQSVFSTNTTSTLENDTLKLVINGYYVEIKKDKIPSNAVGFKINPGLLNEQETVEQFKGIKELKENATTTGAKQFVQAVLTTDAEPTDDSYLRVYTESAGTDPLDRSRFKEEARKTLLFKAYIVGDTAPQDKSKLWIDDQNSFILKFYNEDSREWTTIGSVYK